MNESDIHMGTGRNKSTAIISHQKWTDAAGRKSVMTWLNSTTHPSADVIDQNLHADAQSNIICNDQNLETAKVPFSQ